MSPKIRILGNSHLGALSQAARGNQRFGDAGFDLMYWGAAGGNFPEIQYESGKYISPHPAQARMISGGRCSELDITDADILVFYACHVMPSTQTRRIAVALDQAGGITSSLRNEFFAEMVGSWWQEQTARKLIEAARADFPDLPIVFYCHPLEGKHGGFFSRLSKLEIAHEVLAALNSKIDTWAADQNILFCKQPIETIVDGLFTDPSYARGSVKLAQDEKHPDTDCRHMNAEYGEIILAQLFETVVNLSQR